MGAINVKYSVFSVMERVVLRAAGFLATNRGGLAIIVMDAADYSEVILVARAVRDLPYHQIQICDVMEMSL